MFSISVCIGTHDRAHVLIRGLAGLSEQSRPADEVIVSDSSASKHTEACVAAFGAAHPESRVRYLHNRESALPWHRWNAFVHSNGQVVLFLDDDIRLAPDALLELERVYAGAGPGVAGVGFIRTFDGGSQPGRDTRALRERWLQTSSRPSGTLTPGGLDVSHSGLHSDKPLQVGHLWGGAMSYPRHVLARVGLLDQLVALYAKGLGRAEDIVLSRCAAEHGELLLLTQPLAFHPAVDLAGPTPYAADGWRLGLTLTWGRAHTLRWIAEDRPAYREAWCRTAALEVGRASLGLVRRPWRLHRWARLAGAWFGIGLSVTQWGRIANRPGSVATEGSH